MHPFQKKFFLFGCCLLLLVLSLIALCLGAYDITPYNVFLTISGYLSGGSVGNSYYDVVILDIRIPRIILAIAVGAGLAVAGCVYQGVFRNPLVEPFLLGVSSGAAFGAAIAIVLGVYLFSLQITALLFSLIAVVLAYTLATKNGKTSLLNLILMGIVINALFTAGISFLKTIAPAEQLRDLTFWLMGGLYVADWKDVMTIVPLIIVLSGIIWALSWKLNILAMGDDEAQNLGLNVQTTRALLVFISTMIASLTVATVGIIAWVGLIIPHIARMTVGPDHRILIPVAALFGGMFLLICDTLARTITSGEVPVSILTSVLAAPYIIFLIRKNKSIFVG
jgi:iron complex transport system permease protein